MGCGSSTAIETKNQPFKAPLDVSPSLSTDYVDFPEDGDGVPDMSVLDVSTIVLDDIDNYSSPSISQTYLNFISETVHAQPSISPQFYDDSAHYEQEIYEYEYNNLSDAEKRIKRTEIVDRIKDKCLKHAASIHLAENDVLQSHENVRQQLVEFFGAGSSGI